MSLGIIGSIGVLFMFVLLFAGMPIGLALAFSGFLGLIYIYGISGALLHLGMIPYSNTASYGLSVVPLFILMSEFAFISGLTKDAYDSAYALLGRLRGGLAISTIAACAGFAACTGSSMAGAALMTKVALPEMRRHNYDPALATGCIAAGGTLGILIPPSNSMIFYALITNTSVGKLFIAGIFPGIVLVILFMLVIYIWVMYRPDAGPAGAKFNWRAVFNTSKNLWSVILLVGIVLGGIWGGVFSPTEAAGVGAFFALLIALIKRRLFGSQLKDCLKATLQTTAMIFMILIGSMIFSSFMVGSGLPDAMTRTINSFNLTPLVILIMILIIFTILGCLFDLTGLTFVVLPIVYPIVVSIGIDPILFGVLYTVNAEMALITPPIGMNVFVISGMVKDIPMYTIFKGIVPFFFALVVCIIIIIIFPQIALFLPSTMMK